MELVSKSNRPQHSHCIVLEMRLKSTGIVHWYYHVPCRFFDRDGQKQKKEKGTLSGTGWDQQKRAGSTARTGRARGMDKVKQGVCERGYHPVEDTPDEQRNGLRRLLQSVSKVRCLPTSQQLTLMISLAGWREMGFIPSVMHFVRLRLNLASSRLGRNLRSDKLHVSWPIKKPEMTTT